MNDMPFFPQSLAVIIPKEGHVIFLFTTILNQLIANESFFRKANSFHSLAVLVSYLVKLGLLPN